MIPGGCIQASPSTCIGTPSSPRMLIWTVWHCAIRWCCKLINREAAIWTEPKTATTSNIRSSNDGARNRSPSFVPPQKLVPPIKLSGNKIDVKFRFVSFAIKKKSKSGLIMKFKYGITSGFTSEYWEQRFLAKRVVVFSVHRTRVELSARDSCTSSAATV